MARRVIAMIEVKEVLYQYHQGRSIKAIKRSHGIARNTIRSILKEAKVVGFRRGLPPAELEAVYAKFFCERSKIVVVGPVQQAISFHHEVIEDWLKHPDMTGKQIQRLLQERAIAFLSVNEVYCGI
jgi:hypothetical protein